MREIPDTVLVKGDQEALGLMSFQTVPFHDKEKEMIKEIRNFYA